MKTRYLKIALLLMGMMVMTASCNKKEEPEEIIEEEEEVIPDSEFDFHNDESYRFTTPYAFSLYKWYTTNSIFRGSVINGIDYSSEFKSMSCSVEGGRTFNYKILVKAFDNVDDMRKSGFILDDMLNFATGPFEDHTYVVICWLNSSWYHVPSAPMRVYKKGDKFVLKYYNLGKSNGEGESYFVAYVIREPNIKTSHIRVVGVAEGMN